MAKSSPSSSIEINAGFKRALELMENSSGHIFITGKAGTGKSTLLEYFRSTTVKNTAVLAPTGVAALNVKGQTIHSFCRFKPDITLDKVRKISGRRKSLVENLDTVIVDEISMVRADLFDCMEKFFRLNGPHPNVLFGGVQMILIGDLYQLPPVVTSAEKGIFNSRYETPYFFSAAVFNEPGFQMEFMELEKVYRQTDFEFLALLNAVRNRSIGEAELVRLNERVDPNFVPPEDEFYITLTSTNDLAFRHNTETLERLPGEPITIEGYVEGEFDRTSFPTDEVLKLKPGAQIMLVNNDMQKRWVNGSLGKIVEIHPETYGDTRLIVELESGKEVEVGPHVWEMFRYEIDVTTGKIFTEPVGAFTQYPVRLAWAVTIHKSQGKTFDRVVIDIGRGTFAHGQMYVALSRCTRMEGIVLRKPLRKAHIRMDFRVVRFLTRYQYDLAEEKQSYEDKYDLILSAVQNSTDLDIVYLKTDDTKTRRRISPEAIEMMTYMEREFEGVVARCHKRMAHRVFRIDRMLSVQPMNEALKNKRPPGPPKHPVR